MLEDLGNLLNSFGQLLMSVLPVSPFTNFIATYRMPQGIAWLNWFFPVHQCLTVFAAWLAAYAIYLLYSIIMRWVKVIS